MDIFYWVHTHSMLGIIEYVVRRGLNEDIISDSIRTDDWLGSIKSIKRNRIIGSGGKGRVV